MNRKPKEQREREKALKKVQADPTKERNRDKNKKDIDYVIAIPSYKRANTLAEKTFPILQAGGIDPGRIFVFVADAEQKSEYEAVLPDYYEKILIGRKGMKNARNAIQKYFPENQFVLNLDDDIKQLWRRVDERSLKPIGGDLDRFIQYGFSLCLKHRARLWGIYPVSNPYFMKNSYTSVLRYIEGAFFGVINSHDPMLSVTIDDKEDFERSIRYFLMNGSVVRVNWVCIDTDYYKGSGGMQEERTEGRITKSAQWLLKTYPDCCRDNTRNKAHAEVKLGDYRADKTKPFRIVKVPRPKEIC